MLISIIVPIYNVVLERFQGCMNSLQHQTLTDIEIILVDDCGEMRESILYAQELMKTDSRIKLLTNEQNCGGGASRDKGCAAAFGEYVAFVDADDKVDLDFYEKLYGRTKDRKYDIVKGEEARSQITIDYGSSEIIFGRYYFGTKRLYCFKNRR